MAGGAYLSAKKGAMLLASKHFCRSAGVVASIEDGPSRPAEETHTSRRPKEFRTSSMSCNVSCSLEILRGYPMTFVLGYFLLTSAANEEQSSVLERVQARE